MTKIKKLSFDQVQRRWGWVFIAPWILGFLIFTLIPMVASLVFSFMEFDITNPSEASFVGFRNWKRLTTDPDLITSGITTTKFMLIALPLSILLPLGLAALLNAKNLWFKRFFITAFYVPYMVPAVSFVFIWAGFLNTQNGWLNRFIRLFGLTAPDWLNSTTWIYPALIIIGLWGIGNAMLIKLAGMQGVPDHLYEAAEIDGATPWAQFWNITVPMISPIIFYNLILALVGLFRYFDIPYILKNGRGDPGNTTLFYNIHFYRTTFTFNELGYGATLAWLLFIIALVVTGIVFWSSRYWVYYAAE